MPEEAVFVAVVGVMAASEADALEAVASKVAATEAAASEVVASEAAATASNFFRFRFVGQEMTWANLLDFLDKRLFTLP